MTELLVLLACTQGSGCSQTASAYYAQKPEIKQLFRRHTAMVKEWLGPNVVALYPLAPFLMKSRATINFNQYFSLEVSNRDKSGILLYKFSF